MMELQHKIISVIITILLTAGVFFAGSKGLSVVEEEKEEKAWYSRSDTIYFWYYDESMTDYINKAAVDFGEKNNVHVMPMLVTMDNYLEAVNNASVENNQLPDAYLLGHESLEMAYLTGLACEIDDPWDFCSSSYFSEAALNSVTYQGKKIAYPLSYNTCALIYNVDYLYDWAQQKALAVLKGEGEDYGGGDYFEEIDEKTSGENTEGEGEKEEEKTEETSEGSSEEKETDPSLEVDPDLVPYDELSEEEQVKVLEARTEETFENAAPDTLNELLTIADSYSAPTGVDGVMSWDVTDIMYNYWIVGDVMNLGGPSGDDKKQLLLSDEKVTNCLLRYQHLHNFFNIESSLVAYDKVIQDFIDGKMMFTIASVDSVAKLAEAQKEGALDFTYKYALIPAVDEDTDSIPMSMTEVVVVNGYSEKKDIANAFARYLTGEFAPELYLRTGKAACNIRANNDYENLDVFDAEYAKSVPLPKIIELENFWMEIEALFQRVWDGEDVETELSELENTVRLFFME